MYILGISCYYHDAAAALLKDGKIIAAAEEERFTRKKHDNRFPAHAIHFCMDEAGISIDEIDQIIFHEKPIIKFDRMLHQHLATFPLSFRSFAYAIPSWFAEKFRLRKTLKKKLNYDGDVLFSKHHLSHAASFLASPFDEATIVSIDGVGEWETTAIGWGNDTAVSITHVLEFPHSVGLLYSTFTAFLGFKVNNDEYKVMGMSAYGNKSHSNPFYQKLKKIISINDDGSFSLDMSYFSYHHTLRMFSPKMKKLFGPPRKQESEVRKKHKDIAAAVQLLAEELLIGILNQAYRLHPSTNLVLCGGVALNSLANGTIINKTAFSNIWILPNPGDGGAAIGAALFAYHHVLGEKDRNVLDSPFLGPDGLPEKKDGIIRMAESKGLFCTKLREKELLQRVAELIHDNKIIGWFQGRMEFGPRALGNRSILANPCNPDMKDILNKRIKKREEFRPFAPVVCSDDAEVLFDIDRPLQKPTDYMLMIYPIKEEIRNKIPSVVHLDGTGRLQTIERMMNPRYYDLIKEFGKISGIPVLINTSFNIRGQPIVCTAEEAIETFFKADLDYLVVGDQLVSR